MIISIVGLSGSGKSLISKTLESYNSHIFHVDIDKIGHASHHDLIVKQKIISTFGENILTNFEIDRKKLSHIVFNSKDAMQQLENITWSFMEQQIDKIINNNQNKIILLDWLLLPRTKFFFESDIRLLVTAPLEVRMARVIQRDGLTEEQFLRREASSPELDESQFEYIISNVNLLETQEKVRSLYDKSFIHR